MTTNIRIPLHSEYLDRMAAWAMCRDAIDGELAVKKKDTEYLGTPNGISQAQMKQYARGASWYGASGRACIGLLGTIIRKPPKVAGLDHDPVLVDDIGKGGESLIVMARDSIHEVLKVGRSGLLVDADDKGNPFVVRYVTEDILDWHYGPSPDSKRDALLMVLLREVSTAYDPETFVSSVRYSYRMLYIDQKGDYCQQLFAAPSESNITEMIPVGGVIRPKKSGSRPIREIPFFPQGTDSTRLSPPKPPLLDLVTLNFSHYRLNASQHWGLHWTALPTPWVSGASDTNQDGTPASAPIGSSVAWFLPQDAKCGMLEYSGSGIKDIAAELQKKERLMAILGSRLLEEGKGNTDVAESLRMRLAGDSATLGSIALTASETWTRVLRCYVDWIAPGQELSGISVHVNTDFNMRRMDSQEVIMLETAYLDGAISFEQWHANLQRGELVPDSLSAQEHSEQIQARKRGMADSSSMVGRTTSTEDDSSDSMDTSESSDTANVEIGVE